MESKADTVPVIHAALLSSLRRLAGSSARFQSCFCLVGQSQAIPSATRS